MAAIPDCEDKVIGLSVSFKNYLFTSRFFIYREGFSGCFSVLRWFLDRWWAIAIKANFV